MFGFGKRSDENTPEGTDVISVLTADHRKVDALFSEFEAAERGPQKIRLATQICRELVVHAAAEEQVFYPQAMAALQQQKGEAELIWEATVEHGTLEGLIDTLTGMSAGDEDFDAHMKVLKEYVKHHVKEEENEIFPAVRATGLDLESLGQEVTARKEQIEASLQRERGGNGASGRRRETGSGGASRGGSRARMAGGQDSKSRGGGSSRGARR